MQLRVYNTLTRKKEELVPIKPGQVGILRFGAVFSKTVPMEEWTAAQYRLTPENYAAHRNETVRLLRL